MIAHGFGRRRPEAMMSGAARAGTPAVPFAALLASALAVAACADQGRDPAGTDLATRSADPRPNVLLISLDTLRADRLGSYGYPRDTSPFLDELAERGVRFENAFVNTHGTPPSHATLFSSLFQQTHQVSMRRDGRGRLDHRLPAGIEILPERLHRAGYRTVAVVGGGFMSADFGFDRGFEHFVEESGIEDQTDRLAEELARLGRSKAPIFAFLHTYEIHSPYDPPRSYAERFVRKRTDIGISNKELLRLRREGRIPRGDDLLYLSDLYDAGIRYTDDHLRKLYDRLDLLGFFENHVTVITSDHGEEFGEHGGILHPATLYEELVRIPLLISGTRIRPGKVLRRLVSTIDIAPTLYRLARIEPPAGIQGRDLLRAAPAGADRGVFMQYRDTLAAVRDPRYKLILDHRTGRAMLFDLHRDPGETRDLSRHRAEQTKSMRARLESWLASAASASPEGPASSLEDLDVERREQLRALGYVD
ncbi:MAG: sulfatase, partial [Holophagales bacterium]|nr:sulfatase [Holophagales bacterium]